MTSLKISNTTILCDETLIKKFACYYKNGYRLIGDIWKEKDGRYTLTINIEYKDYYRGDYFFCGTLQFLYNKEKNCIYEMIDDADRLAYTRVKKNLRRIFIDYLRHNNIIVPRKFYNN